jgi:hypothetical protein
VYHCKRSWTHFQWGVFEVDPRTDPTAKRFQTSRFFPSIDNTQSSLPTNCPLNDLQYLLSFAAFGHPFVATLRMSFSASRLVLRRSQFMLSRQAAHSNSTTTQATRAASTTTSRASEAASSASSKASQGLSRVSSSAGPAISGAAKGIGKALGRIGGRTGRFITFVECKFVRFVEGFACTLPDKHIYDVWLGIEGLVQS